MPDHERFLWEARRFRPRCTLPACKRTPLCTSSDLMRDHFESSTGLDHKLYGAAHFILSASVHQVCTSFDKV